MSDVWQFASAYGPWLLAVSGVLVSFYRQDIRGPWRFIVIVAFAALALITNLGTRQSQKSLERQLTGGDCFITFAVTQPMMGNGPPYPLMIFGGCAPLFDVTYTVTIVPAPNKATDEERVRYAMHPVKQGEIKTVLTGAYFTGTDLIPGRYGINVFARNGMTFEILEVPETGPQGQRYYVRRPTLDGLKLLICVPEHDCDTTYPIAVDEPIPPPIPPTAPR